MLQEDSYSPGFPLEAMTSSGWTPWKVQLWRKDPATQNAPLIATVVRSDREQNKAGRSTVALKA